MEKNIVVDVPHDGTEGFSFAAEKLNVDERTLSGGRDFGAREIFLGHPWALHEVVGEVYRDLMDLNRLPRDLGDDGRYKKYGMCLNGQPPGVSLWKDPKVPAEIKEDLRPFGKNYKFKLQQALSDTRGRLVLFGHTMPLLGSGSSTATVPAGEPNALVSIGNGGEANGEGDSLLLPAEQAQFFRQRLENLLSEYFDTSTLTSLTGEAGKVVGLNDYSGRMSAQRQAKTSSGQRPSVLIEWNRALVGHNEDPMFDVLDQQGLKMKKEDRISALHEITGTVVAEYQTQYSV